MVENQYSYAVVDDDEQLADLLEVWLSDLGDVTTAYGGEQALAQIDDSIDLVFLDRQMPDWSGDEVLNRLREDGFSGHVTMVTGEEPDLDVLELEFDNYLTKPITNDELIQTIEDLETRMQYTDQLRTYFTLAQKLALLETHNPREDLAASEDYQQLEDRLEDLQANLETLSDSFRTDDYQAILAHL